MVQTVVELERAIAELTGSPGGPSDDLTARITIVVVAMSRIRAVAIVARENLRRDSADMPNWLPRRDGHCLDTVHATELIKELRVWGESLLVDSLMSDYEPTQRQGASVAQQQLASQRKARLDEYVRQLKDPAVTKLVDQDILGDTGHAYLARAALNRPGM